MLEDGLVWWVVRRHICGNVEIWLDRVSRRCGGQQVSRLIGEEVSLVHVDIDERAEFLCDSGRIVAIDAAVSDNEPAEAGRSS